MLRSFALISALTLGIALPAAAQQLTEQNARKIAETYVEANNKVRHDKDVAAAGALFADDAIRVWPGGTVRGRPAIEKWYTGIMADTNWTEESSTLDQVKVISDNVILITGMWSGTLTTPKGPDHEKGRWAVTYVRDANTWKIAMYAVNHAPQE